jgi:hypothetical protein
MLSEVIVLASNFPPNPHSHRPVGSLLDKRSSPLVLVDKIVVDPCSMQIASKAETNLCRTIFEP